MNTKLKAQETFYKDIYYTLRVYQVGNIKLVQLNCDNLEKRMSLQCYTEKLLAAASFWAPS